LYTKKHSQHLGKLQKVCSKQGILEVK